MSTAVTHLKARMQAPKAWTRWRERPKLVAVSAGSAPPLSPRLQVIRAALLLVLFVSGTLLVHLLVIGSLQHSAAQARKFDSFRAQLAQGVAPVGPLDADGNAITLGTPVAFIEIPSIDVEEVIGEGTSPAVMLDGPGHRRDTPLPGQIGTSVVMGRKASFGGPFSAIGQLDPGDPITVTTGQGVFTYKVIGVRLEGMPVPPAVAAGSSRLTLVTAAGSSFLPSGVLRVDADLEGTAVVGAARLLSPAALPANERVMAGDSRTLWALAMWLQLLILLGVGVVVAWHRWGRAQTWVVFLPPMMLVGLCASGEVTRLLPNLL